MRKVLANLLLTHHQLQEVTVTERAAATELAEKRSSTTRMRPETTPVGEPDVTLTYEVDVVEVVSRYLYRPAYATLRAAARVATRLQSGRLDAYMSYMLLVLAAVIALVAALS
jgi:hypothetical protein